MYPVYCISYSCMFIVFLYNPSLYTPGVVYTICIFLCYLYAIQCTMYIVIFFMLLPAQATQLEYLLPIWHDSLISVYIDKESYHRLSETLLIFCIKRCQNNGVRQTFWCDSTACAVGWLDFSLFSQIVSKSMAKVVYPCQ